MDKKEPRKQNQDDINIHIKDIENSINNLSIIDKTGNNTLNTTNTTIINTSVQDYSIFIDNTTNLPLMSFTYEEGLQYGTNTDYIKLILPSFKYYITEENKSDTNQIFKYNNNTTNNSISNSIFNTTMPNVDILNQFESNFINSINIIIEKSPSSLILNTIFKLLGSLNKTNLEKNQYNFSYSEVLDNNYINYLDKNYKHILEKLTMKDFHILIELLSEANLRF